MRNDDKLCVFAGTYHQFREYCREMKIDHQRDAVFATRTSVMGIHFKSFVRVGTYRDHPDYAFLFQYVTATLERPDPEEATTGPLPFTTNLVTQTDAEKVVAMRKLLETAASLMHPIHTPEMRAWWELARDFVLDES